MLCYGYSSQCHLAPMKHIGRQVYAYTALGPASKDPASNMSEITPKDLQDLLQYFSKNTYRAKDADSTSQGIMQRCILLANLDYTHTVISNNSGDLSAQYPSSLIILEDEKHHNQNVSDTPTPPQRTTETIYESVYNFPTLAEKIRNARFARCRSRFPLPVIFYKRRYVCRSATISGGPEIYGRSGLEYFFPANQSGNTAASTQDIEVAGNGEYEWQLFDKVRSQDIKLLKSLNVGTIIDLMVEKKKVKFGVNVTSSEKVDKEKRYSDFTLVSLPYPGCEFFKAFRENDYQAFDLFFDWEQTHVDADIVVPDDPISAQLHITWDEYKNWNLIHLTQNYFKLILKYLNESSSSMLIHCISGWDRTPLFISLLRISLWADGLIHQSLNAHQMLYFTIAYDWMLFGHDLRDRLAKGEEIFYFCFFFLKHIQLEEYSMHKRQYSQKHVVLRNDSDSQLDNVMFDNDSAVPLSSVSSNLSLNSCCSNVSQNSRDGQDTNPPSVFHSTSLDEQPQQDAPSNGNVAPESLYSSPNKEGSTANQGSRSPLPPLGKRTSPVAVPVPGRVRQRNESSSSGGSWQIISGTGSLRGSTSAHADACSCFSSTTSGPQGQTSCDSSTTVIEEDSYYIAARKNKLETLRQSFYTVYTQSVGLKMKDNSETTGIGQFLGNFAEKVGILSVQRTTL
ncbi:hypothetical protein TSAR_008803 [Trichomalopsis sarcophagae]|uniref:Myotubularin phosphatase domain-containing protein n=1 Tax=Trichomalopsis sarcophagae TaxID=543379 RepID=A0A232F8P8_9HYME|nr:hypothetical protein TSAR_008803 [Trichomalopsis sarcophagae]